MKMMSWRSTSTFTSCCVIVLFKAPSIYMFTPYTLTLSTSLTTQKYSRNRNLNRNLSQLNAKKRRGRDANNKSPSEMNSWYDAVDEDATPDDVFWGEMERQRSINLSPSDIENAPIDPLSAISSMNADGETGAGAGNQLNQQNRQSQQLQQFQSQPPSTRTGMPTKSPVWKDSNAETGGVAAGINTEKVLGSYEAFMVKDNWLDEDYKRELQEDQDEILQEQIEEWQRSDEESGNDLEFDATKSNEPWDFWSEDGSTVERDGIDMDKGTSCC